MRLVVDGIGHPRMWPDDRVPPGDVWHVECRDDDGDLTWVADLTARGGGHVSVARRIVVARDGLSLVTTRGRHVGTVHVGDVLWLEWRRPDGGVGCRYGILVREDHPDYCSSPELTEVVAR